MAPWIGALAAALANAPAFRGCTLRAARRDDEDFLFALHRSAMREYVEATWGWNERWQRTHFAATYVPARQAVFARVESIPADIGRISLTLHWRKIFLRDIEFVAEERNRGLGTATIQALLQLAHAESRTVELFVLTCNPAQRLYRRLGFRVMANNGARLTMRA